MLTSIRRGEGRFGLAVLTSAAGELREGLAVTSRERFSSFPDIPPLGETALPGFEVTSRSMIVGPPRLPPALLPQLHPLLVPTLGGRGTLARSEQARGGAQGLPDRALMQPPFRA